MYIYEIYHYLYYTIYHDYKSINWLNKYSILTQLTAEMTSSAQSTQHASDTIEICNQSNHKDCLDHHLDSREQLEVST